MTAVVQRFSRNLSGRDLVVGDIHGGFSRLQVALTQVGFNPAAGDRLFSVGDLVDRGPDSHMALEWLGQPWFHAVQGNHEDMAIRWPNGHMDPRAYASHGGQWNIDNTKAECERISCALGALPIAIELETQGGLIGIVHANCPAQSWKQFVLDLEEPAGPKHFKAVRDLALWDRERVDLNDETPVEGVRAVIVGHTPAEAIRWIANVIHIDTRGWKPAGGHYTLLNAETLSPEPAAAPHQSPSLGQPEGLS